jgi:hypothetical protein
LRHASKERKKAMKLNGVSFESLLSSCNRELFEYANKKNGLQNTNSYRNKMASLKFVLKVEII